MLSNKWGNSAVHLMLLKPWRPRHLFKNIALAIRIINPHFQAHCFYYIVYPLIAEAGLIMSPESIQLKYMCG